MQDFLRDRNAALLSLDETQLRAYMQKYGVTIPRDPTVFWAGVHKARLAWTKCPPDEQDKSRQWLLAHGFTLAT